MKKEHIIFTEILPSEVIKEDIGQALIVDAAQNDEENGMFIRIQSWDENKEHTEFNSFVGRKVKITIETIN